MGDFLAGRPSERATTEQVDVQVGDGFSAIRAVVDDEAEARLGDALAACDVGGDEEEVSENCGILRGGEGHAWDRLARNDEDVVWGLR